MRAPVRFRSLALTFTAALALPACAASDGDDIEDVDGDGKGDSPVSSQSDRLFDMPFYFSVPKAAVTVALNRPAYPYPTVWNKSTEADDVGLRVIAVRQGAGVAARQTARRDMSRRLAQAGVLQDGDIALTFRPELAGTMPYPHIQMGTTHAGLVYTQDGAAFNIDSPLDTSYVGQFDASHYAGNGGDDAGTDALHIVRPRKLDDRRRAQLRTWVGDLKANLTEINGERRQLKFQSDYLVPAYLSHGATPRQTVTMMGRIILEADTTTELPMYCSEFAWHLLALSNCTAAEILEAGEAGAACVDPVFDPMPLVATTEGAPGLAEGPLASALALPEAAREAAAAAVFTTGDAAKLSSGHRAVAEQVAPLMAGLAQIYAGRAVGVTAAEMAPNAAPLNAQVPPNYSPTAFLVNAMGDETARAMDYVATITFVNAATYDKARTLASQPVP